MKKIVIVLVFCVISNYALGQSLILRSEASMGVLTTLDHESAVIYNYGGKILLGITQKQRFGLKLNYINNAFKLGIGYQIDFNKKKH